MQTLVQPTKSHQSLLTLEMSIIAAADNILTYYKIYTSDIFHYYFSKQNKAGKADDLHKMLMLISFWKIK